MSVSWKFTVFCTSVSFLTLLFSVSVVQVRHQDEVELSFFVSQLRDGASLSSIGTLNEEETMMLLLNNVTYEI